jgi:hypothetical protein
MFLEKFLRTPSVCWIVVKLGMINICIAKYSTFQKLYSQFLFSNHGKEETLKHIILIDESFKILLSIFAFSNNVSIKFDISTGRYQSFRIRNC